MPPSSRHSSNDLTATATPKLRDSCDACAASKVRCDKAKPICGRCSTRKTNCQYLQAKRAGRVGRDQQKKNLLGCDPPSTVPSARGQGLSASVALASTILADGRTPRRRTSDPEVGLIPSAPAQQPSDSAPAVAAAADVFSSTQPPTSPQLSVPIAAELDSFLALLGPESVTQTQAMDFTSQQLQYASDPADHGLPDMASLSSLSPSPVEGFYASDDASVNFSDLFALPQLPQESRTSTSTSYSSSYSTHDTGDSSADGSCGCLLRAMSLLERLLKLAPTFELQPRDSGSDDHISSRLVRVRSLIAEYEKITAAISTVLKCGCSHRGYMLSLIALSTSKVLDGYKAAAFGKEAPSLSDASSRRNSSLAQFPHALAHSKDFHDSMPTASPGSSDAFEVGIDEHDRIAAQLVLGELHQVQSLTSLFSERIRTQVPPIASIEPSSLPADPFARSEDSWAFSATMLGCMATELRSRLRTLSLQIINMLRL